MKNLNNLSFEQIKNNRFLSATSMISIMLVVFAIVVMSNFALNSIITYPQSFANMKSAGAAIDIRSEEYRKNLLSFIINIICYSNFDYDCYNLIYYEYVSNIAQKKP